jgi:hypothetical protein
MMMMMPYRNHLAALRFADRRRREDAAPKLCSQVPGLRSLRLDVHEQVGVGAIEYVWRFVVAHTPALFLVPCGDPRCDGAHDLTTSVMGALRAHEGSFRGRDPCAGSVGLTSCPRVLSFDATAEYAPFLPATWKRS